MKVIVIGAGLIGVTTAFALRSQGHDVTVIERKQSAGRETSFANGAILTPSMSDPWNAPGSWRVLLASLGRSDSPMQLRASTLPSLAGWGIHFLRNSRATTFERNSLSNLRLALYSLQVMQSLQSQTQIEYGRSARGTLRVFRDQAAWHNAVTVAERRSGEGLRFRALSRNDTIALEPALAPIADQLTGALHYETDETGDAYKFCTELTERARQCGVRFHFSTNVSTLEMRRSKIQSIVSGRNSFTADKYIIAAGSYSTPLLRQVGVHLPVRPVKGYSLTFEVPRGNQSLGIPVVDDRLHAVVTPLENKLRVAGTAEFTGFDLRLPASRIRNLENLVYEILPRAPVDPASATAWCGLRPVSSDGVPIIGPTPIENLLVNTGHGHLGWTMAAGSAQLLADLLAGNAPQLDPTLFSFARFTSSNSAVTAA